jgi:parvulin-like peptidyl-prolyl isomerase
MESTFRTHRREFDGSEVAVSHILLRPQADAGPEAVDALVRRAEAIRREITSGKVSFAEAAREHSAGPSARQGGRLGSIARRGAMSEAFSRAAFSLEVGQVSPPVRTPFGVHLIRCDAIKRGSRQWTEVRGDLRKALGRELIDKLARLQRSYSTVKHTGQAPYFDLDTGKLVVP